MHGRDAGRFWLVATSFVSVLLMSCTEVASPPVVEPEAPARSHGGTFDPTGAGALRGRVVWDGPVPDVTPLTALNNPSFHPPWPPGVPEKVFPNPCQPRVNSADRGVGNAVVYLRQVDPAHARPWDHPPVRVSLGEDGLTVEQGNAGQAVGFVRRGDAVAFTAPGERFHVARASGAAFFSLPLPAPGVERERRLTRSGVVELSDGADHFWLRAHLFVADHPYFARTDAGGHFTLDLVPAGEYELVAWMPNWVETDRDRNPESMCISRLYFRPPVTLTRPVRVTAGATAQQDFAFRRELFEAGGGGR